MSSAELFIEHAIKALHANKLLSEDELFFFLTLCTLGKIYSTRQIEFFFLFSPENRIWHFMQIVLQWIHFARNFKSCFLIKIIMKTHQFVVCWISQDNCKN